MGHILIASQDADSHNIGGLPLSPSLYIFSSILLRLYEKNITIKIRIGSEERKRGPSEQLTCAIDFPPSVLCHIAEKGIKN